MPTEEATKWRIANRPSRSMRNSYKKSGALALLPSFACALLLDVIYTTLVHSIEKYIRGYYSRDIYVDDEENEIDEFIADLEAVIDEAEVCANALDRFIVRL